MYYIQLRMEFCVQDVVENVISQICIYPNVCVWIPFRFINNKNACIIRVV